MTRSLIKFHLLESGCANSMYHTPSSEANNSSSSQEIPCILCKQKVYFRVHNSTPFVPILSQINPVHALVLFLETLTLGFYNRSSPMPKLLFIPRSYLKETTACLSYKKQNYFFGLGA
jgi:hypothetical protein